MGLEFSLSIRMRPIRFLFASRPELMGRVLGIGYRVISVHLGIGRINTPLSLFHQVKKEILDVVRP